MHCFDSIDDSLRADAVDTWACLAGTLIMSTSHYVSCRVFPRHIVTDSNRLSPILCLTKEALTSLGWTTLRAM